MHFFIWNKPIQICFFCPLVRSVFIPVSVFDKFMLEKEIPSSAEAVLPQECAWLRAGCRGETLWISNPKFNSTQSLSSLDPFPTSIVVPNVWFLWGMSGLDNILILPIFLFCVFVHHHIIETFLFYSNNALSVCVDKNKQKKILKIFLSLLLNSKKFCSGFFLLNKAL